MEKIPLNKCHSWFMDKLGYCEREKLRTFYHLKNPTLKITNEMLQDIHTKEVAKPEYERLLENRFYNYEL